MKLPARRILNDYSFFSAPQLKRDPLDSHDSMPRYKVLKSVAHNLGHWCMSSLHYLDDDHVSEHLRRAVETTRSPHVRIDALAGTIDPPALRTRVLEESARNAQSNLARMVETGGAVMRQLREAEILIDFDLDSEQLHHELPGVKLRLYECRGRILDDRGKEHVAPVELWWKY